MRKTLFALLGLVAIGIGAVPALAGVSLVGPPKASAPIPLENRAGAIGAMAKNGNFQATLSGTLIKQASATTSWFLYAGACNDRAGGTWVAKTAIQADSLNSYAVGSLGGYGRIDQSLAVPLWNITTTATPANQRPAILNGTGSLWCGKYDVNFVNPVGYPNITQQILYIDLESDRTPINSNTGTYTITMKMNSSTEQNYDWVYFIGGGDNDGNPANGGDEDPITNNRGAFDQIKATGSFNSSVLQATFTGSLLTTTPGLAPFVNGANGPVIIGDGGSQPQNINLNFHMSTDNRALYILMTADCLYSSEDGLWGFGHGVILDDIAVNDGTTTRNIYVDQTTAGGLDAVGGTILVADPVTSTSDGVRIASRVFPGKGELWAIQQGSSYTTADICQPQKNATTDRFFLGVDPVTKNALPGQFNSVVTCTFPVPAGTADITALWGEYLNLPRTTGYAQYSEYRFYKGGAWTNWQTTAAGGGVRTSVIDQWVIDGDPLAAAVQADSFQVRYNITCIVGGNFAVGACDNNTQYAVLYDDLFLQITTGVPAPVFGIFPGSVAQSTFVDGHMTGTNCTVQPCWPGIRGTDLQTSGNPDIARSAVKDNLNSPLGDSLTFSFVTGLRKNGMGINWHFGFDKLVAGQVTPSIVNGAYNSNFDTPRVIYRLYDPLVNNGTWSPWDSTSLDGNNVSVAADTVVIDSEYRLNWPPRDKVGQNLPGGYTVGGQAAYNNLKFLPRGTRMQYYFKAVDINGGTAYQFTGDALAREVEDLPTLPGSANIAPDIVEFDVLPRKYQPGTAGTLVAGRTDSPILNMDANYCVWSFGQDPVTAALRGMGVRADRYRQLAAIGEGQNVGGHDLTGDRPTRLSNYFPNKEEYGLVDSLAAWYRIFIQNSHTSTIAPFDEATAQVVSDWGGTSAFDTGVNGGDRCVFVSGDDAFNALTNHPTNEIGTRQVALSTNIFGVANVITLAPSAAKGSWAGTTGTPYPTVDDRFSAQGSGPGLAAPGTFTYEVDGGCPGPNRFDPLTATGGAVASTTYPVAAGVTDVAALAKSTEFDTSPDLDKTKTLAYGYSIQFVRGTAGTIPRNAANYVRSGVQNRMQILFKFLTGCRGARGSGATCWPCPAGTLMGNWLGDTGFQTTTGGVYGPLYAIQDFTKATGIGPDAVSEAPRVNRIFGNSPNPFNPLTKIRFSAAQAGKVTIRIFNVAGQLVRTLDTKVEKPGDASVYWDGKSDRNLAVGSGVYFYNMTTANGGTVKAEKSMVLVK